MLIQTDIEAARDETPTMALRSSRITPQVDREPLAKWQLIRLVAAVFVVSPGYGGLMPLLTRRLAPMILGARTAEITRHFDRRPNGVQHLRANAHAHLHHRGHLRGTFVALAHLRHDFLHYRHGIRVALSHLLHHFPDHTHLRRVTRALHFIVSFAHDVLSVSVT